MPQLLKDNGRAALSMWHRAQGWGISVAPPCSHTRAGPQGSASRVMGNQVVWLPPRTTSQGRRIQMLGMVPDSHSWHRGAGNTQAELSAPTPPRTTRFTKDCLKQTHSPRTSLFLLNMPGFVLCPALAPQAPSSSSLSPVTPVPAFFPHPTPAFSAPPPCPLPHLLRALLVSPSPLHCVPSSTPCPPLAPSWCSKPSWSSSTAPSIKASQICAGLEIVLFPWQHTLITDTGRGLTDAAVEDLA